jgi:hypothetical protein
VARGDYNAANSSLVMPGLVPGIHVLFFVQPGHDEFGTSAAITGRRAANKAERYVADFYRAIS